MSICQHAGLTSYLELLLRGLFCFKSHTSSAASSDACAHAQVVESYRRWDQIGPWAVSSCPANQNQTKLDFSTYPITFHLGPVASTFSLCHTCRLAAFRLDNTPICTKSKLHQVPPGLVQALTFEQHSRAAEVSSVQSMRLFIEVASSNGADARSFLLA